MEREGRPRQGRCGAGGSSPGTGEPREPAPYCGGLRGHTVPACAPAVTRPEQECRLSFRATLVRGLDWLMQFSPHCRPTGEGLPKTAPFSDKDTKAQPGNVKESVQCYGQLNLL